MQRSAVVLRSAMGRGEAPLLVRLLGRLVLEVLPTTLASIIGAFLFAHYQFTHAAAAGPAAEPAMAAAPASADMVQLVREEHAMIRDLLLAQRVAEKSRTNAADVEDARAAADAELAAAASRRAAVALAAVKPARPHRTPIVIAAASPVSAPTVSAPTVAAAGAPVALPPVVVAGVAPNAGIAPAAAPGPVRASLVGTTFAIPRHVVAATLHAVMAIGGIPSWFGHRFGAENLDSGEPPLSAAS